MADFGVTAAGFTIKGLDVILADAMNRAQQIFDPTIDLTATSPLRKILEVTAAEDAELWKRMEDLYYSNFLSTAVGDNLDLLGEDLGVPRRHLFASGQVQVTLANPTAGRTYLIPQGTILVTAVPVRAFFTTAALTLSATKTQDTVTVQAFERGPAGNIPAATIVGVDPGYAHTFLNLGQATLTVTNPAAFTGGDQHAFMVMRVARETAGEPQVIFQRKLVLKHEYAASELAFRFTRIHVAKGNFNGVGSFGSQVEGLVAARWAS